MENLFDVTSKELEKLREKNGVCFAFSQRQFDEQKRDGVKYVEISSGTLCPKENVIHYMNEVIKIIDKGVKYMVDKYGAIEIIKYEYWNHETQLTGDICTLEESLQIYQERYPEDFKRNIIEKVALDCYKIAIENDLF
jgi:hypothetical protein